jgi:hypothetical protein
MKIVELAYCTVLRQIISTWTANLGCSAVKLEGKMFTVVQDKKSFVKIGKEDIFESRLC